MEILSKTIKKLTDEEYQQLLQEVSGKKKNKPFLVLETTRQREVEDSEMMDILQVNPSAYYTLKSRLNSKIAAILSKKVQNPIQTLMDEVSRVPAHLFGNNREFSVRALRELEKQLIEYDLNAELILVYKTLAQLHLYSEEYDVYETKFNKHVAFSLAVSKAEGLFFRFMKKLGVYQLNGMESDLEEVIMLKRELSNICELYDSHRLYVLYNIAHIYYLCNVPHKLDGLKARELEMEAVLQKMSQIFESYPMDTFYQNIKCITDMLYFEYYVRTQNIVRADYYLQRIHQILPDLTEKHMMNFFVVQFLRSKVMKYQVDGNIDQLQYYADKLEKYCDIDLNEEYHYISMKRYLATVKFYQRDFQGAARKINELRNQVSLKHYLYTDIDSKLFQALQYCIMGDDSLCMQIISSLKRQIREQDAEYESARFLMKLLKTALKPADYRRKIKRIAEMWTEFDEMNKGSFPVISYVKVDENVIRRMSNPIKE
ncbi:MAG: hypothetical protein KBB64_02240 [Bacteroidia bacterium]|jgi:hypothetical protein|nr:hypothetical protein [Bacteroidia bacterium]